jgi:hypothetical protein
VSYTQCAPVSEQAGPVRSAEAAPVLMSIMPFSWAIFRTASATDEVPMPVIIFTPSTSYQRRAIWAPMSGLV